MAAAVLLPKIAAVATCGSVITAVKTSWELSRMVRKKRAETTIAEDSDEVVQLAEDLQTAYNDGLLTRRERDEWHGNHQGQDPHQAPPPARACQP
ncbi:hypothetical protein MAPG_04273 [Magnaporthiopsis poae ATCC 64411]|uniref:Uncharacterized protein n=1 Tax=Magnaporthiopsis poae (strain ATCC 64411 / 73-15) TaxID=644358 RepID=A0A0C4DW99_MAGP6|nr:hypothetical protein MAPG_04273 [Magnaporthiopsis poae ATCC 64411]